MQYSDDYQEQQLGSAAKNTWKRHRKVINPTFSKSKLKQVNISKSLELITKKL